jgi:cell division protein sepF
MGSLDKLKNFFNAGVEEDYVDDDMEIEEIEEDDDKITPFRSKFFASNESSRKNEYSYQAKETKVLVYEPKCFDEASKIVDSLKNKKIVVVNFSNMKADGDKSAHQCQKEVFDFVNGAIYAIEGTIKKISDTIFVIAPPGVDIDTNIRQETEKKGTHRWAI